MYDRHDRPDVTLSSIPGQVVEVARQIGGSLILETALGVARAAEALTTAGLWVLGYTEVTAAPDVTFIDDAELLDTLAACMDRHPAGKGRLSA